MTALHRAALYGTEAAVRLLLRAGARPELRNKEGQSCIEISTAPEIRRLVQASQVPPLPPLLGGPFFPWWTLRGRVWSSPPS